MMDVIKIHERLTRGEKPKYECPDGFIIAGGAIRRWYSGEPQKSDIDLFCADKDNREKWINEHSQYLLYKNAINSTFRIDGRLIQVIYLDFNPTDLTTLWQQFDYHHCCWAWHRETIFTTPAALICTERKHLAILNPQPGYEMDTLRRAFKYQRSGYTPCAGTLLDIAMMLRRVDEEQKLRNQIEISPGGEKRIIRFD